MSDTYRGCMRGLNTCTFRVKNGASDKSRYLKCKRQAQKELTEQAEKLRKSRNTFLSGKRDVGHFGHTPRDWKETCKVNAKTAAGEADKDLNG